MPDYFSRSKDEPKHSFDEYLKMNPEFQQWLEKQRSIQPQQPSIGISTENLMDTGGATYAHSYYNSGPNEGNKCGQAAIATIIDFYGKDLNRLPKPKYDNNDEKYHWDDGAAITKIVEDGFKPDVIFGYFGTSGGLIRNALQHYGLRNCSVGFSGVADSGWEAQWKTLQTWVAAGHPCPVLVDVGTLGGKWWYAHWLVVYRIDGDGVHVANWKPSSLIKQETFLAAWACHWLPYGYNHCFVTSQP